MLTLAQYGDVMAPNYQVAEARGSGKWNPPPRWEQSTNRGNVWENAKPGNLPAPLDLHNVDYQDLTTNTFNDIQRSERYYVGSTGIHAENPGSWKKATYVENQYVDWALKALVPGGFAPTPFVTYFFSNDNVAYLQKRIVEEIKRITGEDIAEQSVDSLLIIMRNKIIYAYSGGLPSFNTGWNEPNNQGSLSNIGSKPCSIQERLVRVNKAVLQEAIRQVISGINMYKQYYKDQSSMPMPLSRPTYTTMKGSRELSEQVGFDSGLGKSIKSQSYNERFNII